MAHVIDLSDRREQVVKAALAAARQRLLNAWFPDRKATQQRLAEMRQEVLRAMPPPRTVRPDKSETPAVAAAGVPEVPTPDRSTAMQTLPQPRDAAIKPNKPLAEVGTAQHTALMRWFARAPLSVVCDALEANPAFPLVSCAAQPRHFAPARGTPQPAA